MSSTTPTARAPRRLRRAGSVAAAAALALTAAVGLGIAPASAAPTATAEQSGAGDSASVGASALRRIDPSAPVQVQVHTHWAASGPNVRSIRVNGSPIFNGRGTPTVLNRCYTMGRFTPGVIEDKRITITLSPGIYSVTSYADGACQVSEQRVGGYSSAVSPSDNWTVFVRQGVQADY